MNDTTTTPDPGATPPPMTAAELATIALGTLTPPDPAVGTPTPMEPAPGESSSPSPPATADGTPAEPAPPVERKSTVERRIDTLVAEKHAARAAAAEADRRARLAEETLVELKRLAATTHSSEDGTPAPAPSGTGEPTYTAADLQR